MIFFEPQLDAVHLGLSACSGLEEPRDIDRVGEFDPIAVESHFGSDRSLESVLAANYSSHCREADIGMRVADHHADPAPELDGFAGLQRAAGGLQIRDEARFRSASAGKEIPAGAPV